MAANATVRVPAVTASVPAQSLVIVVRSAAVDVPRVPVLVRPHLVETASATRTASVPLATVAVVPKELAPVRDRLVESASAIRTASAPLTR